MPSIDSLNIILKENKIPSVLLMFGEEDFLLDEDYDKLITKLLPNEEAKYDFEYIDATESDFNRIVVLNNFDNLADKHSKKDNQHAGFQKYLDNPQLSTCLIIKADLSSMYGITNELNSPKNSAKAKKKIESLKFPYHTLFEKHLWIEYPKVTNANLSSWVKNRFKLLNKTIDSDACEFLIANSDMIIRDLSEEINKVVLFTGDKKNVSLDDMAESIGKSRHYNVFELQKAVGARNLALSLKILQNMLSAERQEILIVTMISRYFLALWKLVEAQQESTNQYDIAGKVGISPYFVQEYQDAAKRYSTAEINRAIKLLTEVDYKLKSSSIPALLLLEKLFIGIMEK